MQLRRCALPPVVAAFLIITLTGATGVAQEGDLNPIQKFRFLQDKELVVQRLGLPSGARCLRVNLIFGEVYRWKICTGAQVTGSVHGVEASSRLRRLKQCYVLIGEPPHLVPSWRFYLRLMKRTRKRRPIQQS
jgi:hypothetical protein